MSARLLYLFAIKTVSVSKRFSLILLCILAHVNRIRDFGQGHSFHFNVNW